MVVVDIHHSAKEKMGGVPLFNAVVLDKKGNPIGMVTTDDYGNSVFSEGIKK